MARVGSASLWHFVLVSGCLLAAGAGAQTPPNIGDALRQSRPPEMPAAAAPALPAIGGAEVIEPPMAEPPGAPAIDVKSIQIVGNRVIATETLQALVADGKGRSMGLAGLDALSQRITRYYRTQGYFVARAYVPAQEVVDGLVRIRVVEGNYGRFHLANRSLVRDATVQAMLDDAKKNDIVSVDTLERAMLIINDTPGVVVTRADVMPGERVGTSDFAVDTAARARYEGFVAFDNYGSVYTGKDRASFNVDVNSVTTLGDRLSVSGLQTDGNGLHNLGLTWSVGLLPNGLRGELRGSQVQYQLGGVYAPLVTVGTARDAGASLVYPLRRTHSQTINTRFAIDYKDLVDEVRATGTRTPKTVKSASVGSSLNEEGRLLGFDGQTQAGVDLTWGDLAIGDATALALDQAGARTAGSYQKLVLSVSRSSALPARLALDLSLRLQLVNHGRNLDGSERMAVTGPGGVLAYAPEQLIGDDALVARAQLAQPFPSPTGWQFTARLYTDYGQARDGNALGVPQPGRHLSDIGLGVDALFHGASVQAGFAHRLQTSVPTAEPTPHNRFLIQAGYSF